MTPVILWDFFVRPKIVSTAFFVTPTVISPQSMFPVLSLPQQRQNQRQESTVKVRSWELFTMAVVNMGFSQHRRYLCRLRRHRLPRFLVVTNCLLMWEASSKLTG